MPPLQIWRSRHVPSTPIGKSVTAACRDCAGRILKGRGFGKANERFDNDSDEDFGYLNCKILAIGVGGW